MGDLSSVRYDLHEQVRELKFPRFPVTTFKVCAEGGIMSDRFKRAVFILLVLPSFASAMGRRSTDERSAKLPQVVVIDAGHGGKNEGAIVHGRRERDIVLALSLKLQEQLEARPGISPFLTRWADEFVSLTDRVSRAEEVGGRLFLSLHVDNNRVRKGRGVMVYVYGRNKTIPKGPEREPDEKILPPPPGKQVKQSRRFAAHIGKTLKKSGIRTAGYVDKGPFAVLKSKEMPSVLVELGNLRDRSEARQVSNPAFQDRLAEALADGIESFLKERYGPLPGHSAATR